MKLGFSYVVLSSDSLENAKVSTYSLYMVSNSCSAYQAICSQIAESNRDFVKHEMELADLHILVGGIRRNAHNLSRC